IETAGSARSNRTRSPVASPSLEGSKYRRCQAKMKKEGQHSGTVLPCSPKHGAWLRFICHGNGRAAMTKAFYRHRAAAYAPQVAPAPDRKLRTKRASFIAHDLHWRGMGQIGTTFGYSIPTLAELKVSPRQSSEILLL